VAIIFCFELKKGICTKFFVFYRQREDDVSLNSGLATRGVRFIGLRFAMWCCPKSK